MDENSNEQIEQVESKPAVKRRKKWPIIVGACVAFIVVIGIGMWVWHEQPSFCNAFCHTPMDDYLVTYEAESGAPATDKWGNEVANANAMLVITHKDQGIGCLGCHEPSIAQQLKEVSEEITGNYYYPLAERNLAELLTNAGKTPSKQGDEFCLKSGCHDVARNEMASLTADFTRNPHSWQHEELACSDCHKSHRASVYVCTECHQDAEAQVPEGWVAFTQGDQILEDYALAA